MARLFGSSVLLMLLLGAGTALGAATCSAVTELAKEDVRTHGCAVEEKCHRAYVASLDLGVFEFDVRDPTKPKETRFVKGGRSNWLATKGEYVFVADGASLGVYRFPADGTTATKVTEFGLPAALSGGVVRHVVLSGDRAFVALGPDRGMMVVDVSAPGAPTLVGYVKDGAGTMVHPIAGTGLALLVDHGVGVRVVDTGATATPQGEFAVVHTYALAGAQALAVAGNVAYVGTARSGSGGDVLEELDISAPTSIARMQSKGIGYKARHIEVHGNLVYVAGDTSGVFVHDALSGLAEVQSHNLGGQQVTGLTVRGDLVFASTAHNGHLYVLRMDCGLPKNYPAFPTVTVVPPAGTGGATVVPGEEVNGRSELDGWKHLGDGSRVHVKNLPQALQGGRAYFPDQVTAFDAGTTFELHCPDNRCGRPCEFFIAVWHCPPCTKDSNGGLPGLLPPADWEPRSCAPKWAKTKGGRYEPMVTFRKVVPEGTTETTPATDRALRHMMVFAVPDSEDCEDRLTETACKATTACKWEGMTCKRVWCPINPVAKPGGPTPCHPCQN